MIDSDDYDSDWSSFDESEDEDAVDISYEVQQIHVSNIVNFNLLILETN